MPARRRQDPSASALTRARSPPPAVVDPGQDIGVESESAPRCWWRTASRPGKIITHAPPAYLYGGGVMLQGAYEYFGLLSIWVPPPDTDDLAEQALRLWM